LPSGPGGGSSGPGSGGGPGSSGGAFAAGPSIDELAATDSASGTSETSSVLLVRHLAPDATEAAVADAFRVFAPVRVALPLSSRSLKEWPCFILRARGGGPLFSRALLPLHGYFFFPFAFTISNCLL
jgi:hypothetical protein